MKYLVTLLRRWLERRDIFHYWDGRTFRCADPFVIYRGLSTHPEFDWETDPKMLSVADPAVVLEVSARLAKAVRDVFGLPAVEQGGLTELECQSLLAQFGRYKLHVKKNIRPSLTPSVSSASDQELSATKSGSDCTSTETDKTCNSPISSLRESAGD